MSALNVLLVDDDRNLATTLSYGLHKAMGEGISVIISFNTSEALSLFATQTFDVVVSDFNLPDLSGLEFLHKIRQDHPETILVLITAYGTDALEEEVRRLGMDYITKPFELPLLVQLIRDKETKDRTEKAQPVTDKLEKPDGSSQSVCFEAST